MAEKLRIIPQKHTLNLLSDHIRDGLEDIKRKNKAFAFPRTAEDIKKIKEAFDIFLKEVDRELYTLIKEGTTEKEGEKGVKKESYDILSKLDDIKEKIENATSDEHIVETLDEILKFAKSNNDALAKLLEGE